MANDREEMEKLAQMAEEMDAPPVYDEKGEQVDQGATQRAVPEDELSDVETTTGGLDGGEVAESEEPMVDIDELLGIKGKPVKEVEEEEVTEPKIHKEAEEEQPSRRDERIAELAATVQLLKEQNEQLIKKALDRSERPQEEEQPELNPEVLEYMKPYMRAIMGSDLEELRNSVQPLRQQAEDTRLAQAVSKHVPGFTAEHMPKLREAFGAFNEGSEEFALYGGGVAGAALLAQDLVRRGALDIGQPKKRQPSPLAKRHITEATDTNPELRQNMSDEEKARRMMQIPDEKILRLLDEYEVE